MEYILLINNTALRNKLIRKHCVPNGRIVNLPKKLKYKNYLYSSFILN